MNPELLQYGGTFVATVLAAYGLTNLDWRGLSNAAIARIPWPKRQKSATSPAADVRAQQFACLCAFRHAASESTSVEDRTADLAAADDWAARLDRLFPKAS